MYYAYDHLIPLGAVAVCIIEEAGKSAKMAVLRHVTAYGKFLREEKVRRPLPRMLFVCAS